jgi:NAD(P)-dependent dehydrogenase (short-subunit alcohol dehydrogenase family)
MQRLLFVTGDSAGIGAGIAAAARRADATVAGMSRRSAEGPHLEIDLGEPTNWQRAIDWIDGTIAGHAPDWVGLVHCAATLDPIGFAGAVDLHGYRSNVLLNSAAPQVLGAGFLTIMDAVGSPGALMQISSGAASTVYPGWSSYCAAKAAVDQWTRVVGAERTALGSPVRVMAVAPGVVATGMQDAVRGSAESDFPTVQRFRELHDEGHLADPAEVGRRLWDVLIDDSIDQGSVLDLRKL